MGNLCRHSLERRQPTVFERQPTVDLKVEATASLEPKIKCERHLLTHVIYVQTGYIVSWKLSDSKLIMLPGCMWINFSPNQVLNPLKFLSHSTLT